MKRKLVLAALAVLGGLAVSACSGSTTGGGTSTVGPVPQQEFGKRLAQALCDNIGGCCQQAGLAYDPVKCAQALAPFYSELFTGGKASYDANKAGECVAYAANVAKTCGSSPDPGPCDDVSVGSVPNGGQCEASADCIRPPEGSVDCNDGICVQEPRGKLGDACEWTCTESGSSTSCSGGGSGTTSGPARCYTNDGLQCSADGKCAPLVPVGGSCASSGCVAQAYCNWSSGTCDPRVALGGDCASSDACVAAAYCDSASKCVAALADGAACGDDEQCASGDCSGGKCGGNGLANPVFCSGQIN